MTLETVAHLIKGLERKLLPQAEFLRELLTRIRRLNRVADGTGPEERIMELIDFVEEEL